MLGPSKENARPFDWHKFHPQTMPNYATSLPIHIYTFTPCRRGGCAFLHVIRIFFFSEGKLLTHFEMGTLVIDVWIACNVMFTSRNDCHYQMFPLGLPATMMIKATTVRLNVQPLIIAEIRWISQMCDQFNGWPLSMFRYKVGVIKWKGLTRKTTQSLHINTNFYQRIHFEMD